MPALALSRRSNLGAAGAPPDPPAFPYTLSALHLVLDPDEIAGDGVAVAGFTPAVGSAYSQASGAAQPLIVANVLDGHKALRFDGSDSMAQASGAPLPQPNSMALVASANLAGGYHFWTDSRGSRSGIYAVGTLVRFFAGAEANYGTVSTDPHLFVVSFDGASSKMWVDGGTPVTTNPGSGAMNAGGIIGDGDGGGAPVTGDILFEIRRGGVSWSAGELDELAAWAEARWPSLTIAPFVP